MGRDFKVQSGGAHLRRSVRSWGAALAGAVALLSSSVALPSLNSSAGAAGISPSTSGTTSPLTVTAMDNIWGAGLTTAPDPGGYGGGVVPVQVAIPQGAKWVTFPHVTGSVSFGQRGESNPNGPDGNPDAKLNTNISAFGGISGLQDTASYFYLVGVFLHGKQPASPPATLNFTDLHSFKQLAPLKGQVFFVGDGLTGTGSGSVQHFKVPLGATDLYLGFADAPYALGPCGAYSDNFGSVSAVVQFSIPPTS